MSHFLSSFLFAVLVLSLGVCAQDKPTLGVMEVTFVPKITDEAQRELYTSTVRGRVIDLVHDSVDVIEGSKLERLIQVNAASCNASSCLAQFAKSLGVDYLLGTRVISHSGIWSVTVSLASSLSSSMLSEKVADFESESALRKGLAGVVTQAVASFVKDEGGAAYAGSIATDEAPLVPPLPNAKKVVIAFMSVPSGAAVSVDGSIACASTPCKRSFLQGTHRLEMVKDGWRSRKESVEFLQNGQSVNWSLTAILTRLSLDAVDDRNGDALIGDVYVDGAKVGQTPFDGLVAIGASRIEVGPEGFDRQSVSISLEEGKPANATVHFRSAEPRPTVSELPIARRSSFMDSRDGHTYRSISIGSRTWMAENLNYEVGASWCYDDNENNCQAYGRLYDWRTAKIACPEGWHLPSDEEWRELAKDESQGSKSSGKPLKSRSWGGTDAIGFNVLPGGFRFSDGSFNYMGSSANFWSSSQSDAKRAWHRDLSSGLDVLHRYAYDKTYGFSVRCVKNSR